jgi:hypothetical protein
MIDEGDMVKNEALTRNDYCEIKILRWLMQAIEANEVVSIEATEEVFSLEAGTEAYLKLHAEILGRPDVPEAAPAVAHATNNR